VPSTPAPDDNALHQASRRGADHPGAVGARQARAREQDDLTPLQLAEKPPAGPGNATVMDQDAYQPPRNTRDEVIAALRELMGVEKP
jgi:hypothetical protein